MLCQYPALRKLTRSVWARLWNEMSHTIPTTNVETQAVAAVAHQSLAKLGRRHTQPYGLRVTRLRQAAAPPKAGFHPVRPVCDDEVGRPAQPVQFLSTSTSRAGEKCNIHHPTHKAARVNSQSFLLCHPSLLATKIFTFAITTLGDK